jgi:DNA-binding NarL/FixJ family response regulator
MARRRPFNPDDSSRPPLFTADEWARLVREVKFSPSHAQVVGRVMQGQCYEEIAEVLGISDSVVRKHFNCAKQRLARKVALPGNDQVAVICGLFSVFRNAIEGKRFIPDNNAPHDGQSAAG